MKKFIILTIPILIICSLTTKKNYSQTRILEIIEQEYRPDEKVLRITCSPVAASLLSRDSILSKMEQ